MLAYAGDEDAARNSWRRWYFAHIIPRHRGKDLQPMCCMHLFQAQGKPEFTGATEENQIAAIDSYLQAGIHPDVWWIDAGWYPCDYVWGKTGNWYPNRENFPRGLKPVGDKCHENGMEFLLWFEPERVREDTEFANDHPQWLIPATRNGQPTPNYLVDLGNRECCDYMIGLLDGYIKDFGGIFGNIQSYRRICLVPICQIAS
jgi:alpha-galactosidase